MTSAQRFRAVIKAGFTFLGRFSWYSAQATRLVRLMTRGSFRLLKSNPAIRNVFVRGSYVRGPFVPFSSDVDLVLLLSDEAGHSYEGVRTALKSLERARAWNVNIRDWWQHMILESEIPTVETFWPLFGAEEWRDEKDACPVSCSAACDNTLLAFATWVQACSWSGSAVQAFLFPRDPIHSLTAGVKKTQFMSTRLSMLLDRGDRPFTPSDLVELKVRHAKEVAQTFRPPPRIGPGARAALREVIRALESSAGRIRTLARLPAAPPVPASPGLPANVRAVFHAEHALFVVLASGLTDEALETAFDAVAAMALPQKRVTFFVPEAAYDIWPYPPADLVTFPGEDPVAPPQGHARELQLFDSLFLASGVRLSLVFNDSPARLRRLLFSLLRACLLYGFGRVETTPPAIARACLERRETFASVPGLDPLLQDPSKVLSSREMFGICTAVSDTLQPILVDFSKRKERF